MNEINRIPLDSLLQGLSEDSIRRLPRRMSALISERALSKANREVWRFSRLDAASDEVSRSFVATVRACVSRTPRPRLGWSPTHGRPLNAILGEVPFYGILDKSGQWVVKPELEALGDFEDGLACAKQ